MNDHGDQRPHLDPPLRSLFDALAAGAADESAPDPEDHTEIRRRANETMLLVRPPLAPGTVVGEYDVDVDGGTIRVRTYHPDGLAPGGGAAHPALFFIHGGGWYQGNLDTAEVEMGSLPELAECVGVSVEYRLAPEHPFPTPLRDCAAAYDWTLAHAADLGIDVSRLAIAGTSAGGNLAAALCVLLRDTGRPLPIVQLLDVPATDLTLSSPSVEEVATGAGLTKEATTHYATTYLGGADPRDPLASPLFADLAGVPPAVVIVAENDPLRDDGERFLRRLHEHGVAAAGFRVLAQFHGSWIVPITVTSRLVPDIRVATLRRAFATSLTP